MVRRFTFITLFLAQKQFYNCLKFLTSSCWRWLWSRLNIRFSSNIRKKSKTKLHAITNSHELFHICRIKNVKCFSSKYINSKIFFFHSTKIRSIVTDFSDSLLRILNKNSFWLRKWAAHIFKSGYLFTGKSTIEPNALQKINYVKVKSNPRCEIV